MKLPKKNQMKLNKRMQSNALRSLSTGKSKVDFSSNDYLGFSQNEDIYHKVHALLSSKNMLVNGATGSRLLSGNHALYEEVETMLCEHHQSEAALLFNSGYNANIGFFSTVPQRDDLIFYDEFIHASIRDGITMSHAKAYKFKHNDLRDLKEKLALQEVSKNENSAIYIVTESVFSMDGDTPNLKTLAKLCREFGYHLIVDEAHAIGVFGKKGEGIVQALEIQDAVFARIITFGKALGCHGAAVLGSESLKTYLVNFSRSFIYTTALSPHAVATIKIAYEELNATKAISDLRKKTQVFKALLETYKLPFITSDSAIHCCIVSGNDRVKEIAKTLQTNGYDVKPILSPTVPKRKERLRFCLHAYNSEEEIVEILKLLTTLV